MEDGIEYLASRFEPSIVEFESFISISKRRFGISKSGTVSNVS